MPVLFSADRFPRIYNSVIEMPDMNLSRRTFLLSATVAFSGVAVAQTRSPTVLIEGFSPAGKSLGQKQVARITKTDEEWRWQLPPESYIVTRTAETERPGSGIYLTNHEAGIYRCVCCETALYDSQTKFESGTGWPSFWQPISRLNVVESSDTRLREKRTAVSCSLCEAHLGHVFADGPEPTGLRYCMNSVALHFAKRP
jgi:peptide-methionine (R)-S-oxide reductase